MFEFLPHMQKNSKRYWNNAINLSLPLLFARKIEKYVEKSVAFITKFFIGYPAFVVKFIIDVDCLNLFEFILSRKLIIL
jgi:hypothetical protein